MKAIVLAGGKGSRLYPYSATLPKPLMPLGNMPVLELLLRQLRHAGIDEVTLAVNYLRHLIEAFFGDGTRFGIPIQYSVENEPLGTAGPMAAALDRMGDHFMLLNGDLLTSLDFREMISAHLATAADITIGVFEREVRIDFGLIDVDAQMRMVDYREKPSHKQLISMGVYVIRTAAVREFVKLGERLDMPQLLMTMMRAGYDLRCHRQDCVWLDIGRPDDFALAQEMFETEMHIFQRFGTK
jgi:NDP-sugar pyrophosphorylase family protein